MLSSKLDHTVPHPTPTPPFPCLPFLDILTLTWSSFLARSVANFSDNIIVLLLTLQSRCLPGPSKSLKQVATLLFQSPSYLLAPQLAMRTFSREGDLGNHISLVSRTTDLHGCSLSSCLSWIGALCYGRGQPLQVDPSISRAFGSFSLKPEGRCNLRRLGLPS